MIWTGRPRGHWYVVATLVVPLLAGCIGEPHPSPEAPNILFIQLDDLRADELPWLPSLEPLVANGTFYEQYVTTTSLCCPSRAALLTGQFSHSHGIWMIPEGAGEFHGRLDDDTFVTRLHDAGYSTGVVGKYMNGLGAPFPGYVPPGWDQYVAAWSGEPSFFDYVLNTNGEPVVYGSNETDYLTDVISRETLRFLQDAPEPFFFWMDHYAPHEEVQARATVPPAPRHADSCPEVPPLRPPSFNEDDTSDKRETRTPFSDETIAELDRWRAERVCSLRAVDESIASALTVLETRERPTVVVFTSDNGFLLGEHRITSLQGTGGDKNRAYEETVRVPLITYDPRDPGGKRSDLLVANIDLAPTMLVWAGLPPAPQMDGEPLQSLAVKPRDQILTEHYRGLDGMYQFSIRTAEWKYVQFALHGEIDFEEFYDLAQDPFELESRIDDPRFAQEIQSSRDWLHENHPYWSDPDWTGTATYRGVEHRGALQS